MCKTYSNDCCPHLRRCRYGVGVNAPGYLPDGDVTHFGNFSDALRIYCGNVLEAYREHADNIENEDDAATVIAKAEQVVSDIKRAAPIWRKNARSGERGDVISVRIGDLEYWLARIG